MKFAAYKMGCVSALADLGLKVGGAQAPNADWFTAQVGGLGDFRSRASSPELRRHKLERATTWSAPASLESASAINWNNGIMPYGGV